MATEQSASRVGRDDKSESGPVGAPERESASDEPAGSRSREALWRYRSVDFGSSEFSNSLIHFYRAEVMRANVWRQRLDATTNWAVISTGAALSFTFGSTGANLHVMVPISTLLVTLFLVAEARRYRYYELWSTRVRLMETNYFAAMLAEPHRPSASWAGQLADSLLHPQFTISSWEAFGRRFRRNYQYIYLLLAIAWINKIALHPVPVRSLQDFVANAHVGVVPGELVIATGLLFYLAIFAVGWLTAGLRKSRGEVLSTGSATDLLKSAADSLSGGRVGLPRRHERLGHVITSRGEEVAVHIMERFGRGVTSLPARGMYSGEERNVLMVALDPEQAHHLEETVYSVDPKAFVIIHGTERVLGSGFRAPS